MTLTKLHNDHGDYLLYCLRMYGVSGAACEDVRQDIYLKMLERETDLSKIDRTPRGFCSTVCRHAAFNWLRGKRRAPSMESLIVISPTGFEGMHPEVDKHAAETWDRIANNPTGERIREALVLAQLWDCQPGGPTAFDVMADLLYGITMADIGVKEGVSKATVSRWMREWTEWVNLQLPKGAAL